MHESIIGKPYFWQKNDGTVMVRHKGHVFRVPHRNVSRETLDALAAKCEAAMLERLLTEAARGRR